MPRWELSEFSIYENDVGAVGVSEGNPHRSIKRRGISVTMVEVHEISGNLIRKIDV
jgi:hypothetical protein